MDGRCPIAKSDADHDISAVSGRYRQKKARAFQTVQRPCYNRNFGIGPVALYGVLLLCIACAYWLLQRSLIKAEAPDCLLALGGRWRPEARPTDRAQDRAGGAAAGRRPLTNISRGYGIFCNLACARPNC
jgi:hypothetical protein